MKEISVPRPQSDSLAAQLLSLYKTFKNILPSESLEFELSSLDWICPFLILPISVYISDTKSKFAVNDLSTIKPYLEVIKFPKGVDSISSFEQQIQRHKNYIPISVLKKDAGIARGRLESLFQTMVYKNFGSISGAQNAIYYPISELVTNIFEHSKRNEGFVFGQFYPTKRYLDICVVDRGRGLRKAYQQEKGLQLSDEDAITEVMKGNSIKPDQERGYGVCIGSA